MKRAVILFAILFSLNSFAEEADLTFQNLEREFAGAGKASISSLVGLYRGECFTKIPGSLVGRPDYYYLKDGVTYLVIGFLPAWSKAMNGQMYQVQNYIARNSIVESVKTQKFWTKEESVALKWKLKNETEGDEFVVRIELRNGDIPDLFGSVKNYSTSLKVLDNGIPISRIVYDHFEADSVPANNSIEIICSWYERLVPSSELPLENQAPPSF